MNPDSYLVLMDPDPGGPKTSGFGSGSATLLLFVSRLSLVSVLVQSLAVHLFLFYLSHALFCIYSCPFSVPHLVLIVF
jgi:hypothetical protein